MDTFAHQFCALTGNDPFPWQSALYERMLSDLPEDRRVGDYVTDPIQAHWARTQTPSLASGAFTDTVMHLNQRSAPSVID